MSKGRVFIISGPSGSGKDTLLKILFERYPNMKFSISSTTRPMREGEVEGEKYNFISKESFLSMLANDELLEHNEFVGNFYGTPKKPVMDAVSSGEDIIIEVDVNGAAQIREKMPEVISIFIMPPSLEVLKARLSKRGTETKALVEKRLCAALDEIRRAEEYNYIIVNDALDEAIEDITTVINSEKFRLDRQQYLINQILDKA
ncbi:MAG: guanylate kinase [Oscillospiraceae bacterium]|nr:guanylate kinase [Oscillospiraceae bacterium]